MHLNFNIIHIQFQHKFTIAYFAIQEIALCNPNIYIHSVYN